MIEQYMNVIEKYKNNGFLITLRILPKDDHNTQWKCMVCTLYTTNYITAIDYETLLKDVVEALNIAHKLSVIPLSLCLAPCVS